jgi:tyrosyl-tRNA synthetase
MSNALDVLRERHLIQQHTDEGALRKALDNRITCYVGFDGTAASLHVGHLIPLMALSHMQRAGHRPIAVAGGGTSMIGDPSGKTEMRRLISAEEVASNVVKIGQQIGRFLEFKDGAALLVDNAEWLLELKYIEFLRDIGRHFSVNRMLAAEAYKQRLERGLSFIEFNYQLLQAYDYLTLHQRYGCSLQMGGDDQWGNILAGVDLVRRVEGAEVHALTYPLLTTSDGKKMGKTEAGAVWLDAELLKPYDYYQYWINTDDRDIERLLAVFTFLPTDEIRELGRLEGANIRQAKRRLAFEATALNHGLEAARRAEEAAEAAFGSSLKSSEHVPTTLVAEPQWRGLVLDLFVLAGLSSSKSEARRLIAQGGASVNDRRIDDDKQTLSPEELAAGEVLLRAGKKKYHRVVLAR